MRWTALILGLAMAAGCERETAQTSTPAKGQADALPAGLVLPHEPAGAQDLAAVRKEAGDGESVVVRARVGGRKDPLTPGRAVMTVIDKGVKSCDQVPGDSCATPWDYCCETPEDLLANSATVQVVDAEGKPVKAGLDGVGGIKPLKEVVVQGKLKKPDPKTAVIEATGIWVKDGAH